MARRKLDKQKLKLEFLERLTAGESHTAITDDPHMPDWSTVYRWAKADKEFAADIAEAKFERGDAITAIWSGKIADIIEKCR